MFTKINLFLGVLFFSLALSASASESAGRYNIGGPSNSGSGGTAGRFAVATSGGEAVQSTPTGQQKVAGRYAQSQESFAVQYTAPATVPTSADRSVPVDAKYNPTGK